MSINTSPQPASTPVALNQQNLERIAEYVPVPNYNREALKCGIVHISVGGFHRAHQAVYVHKFLEQFEGDWMICGVGLLPGDKENIDALKKQDGLYTVIERTAAGDEAYIVGSMKTALHAPSESEAVMAQLCDPATRILSLTITEKGYCYNKEGDLDLSNALLQKEKESGQPLTAYGYALRALKARKEAGIAPFTIMSCDNLPGNGDLTRRLFLQYAEENAPDMVSWIEENVTFPNAMVDRITPVTTQAIVDLARDKFLVEDQWPVVCEDYLQWVLEDKFCNGRPALDEVGVQIVPDVHPYEKMKVRLLNGSHSALAYLSYLMGYRAVDKAMADPLIAKFVRAYMDKDVTPSVPDVPGVDLKAYKDKLIERFSNPAISDQVQRLAEDGSAKIPNSILPCIRHQLDKGGSIEYAALALAGWFRYLSGVDEEAQAIDIKDPMADKLRAKMQLDSRDPTAILGVSDLFGTDLPTNKRFVMAVKVAMESLAEKGARATLQEML
jgi:mannitol 2-dehydrogenase